MNRDTACSSEAKGISRRALRGGGIDAASALVSALVVCYGLVLGTACPGPSKQGGGPGTAGPPTTAVERPEPGARPRPDGPAPERPVSRQLEKDEVVDVGGGGRVTVPARWHVTAYPRTGYAVLQEPDRELWMALCSVEAPNVQAAITEAWKRARPRFALAVKDTVTPPVKDGWDLVTQVVIGRRRQSAGWCSPWPGARASAST